MNPTTRLIFPRIFAVILIASLLAACGSAPSSAPGALAPTRTKPPGSASPIKAPTLTLPPARTSVPLPAATPTPLPPITLDAGQVQGAKVHFAHPWSGETASAIKRLVTSFNLGNQWDIEVVITSAPGSSAQLLEQIEAAPPGEQPDLIAAPFDHLVYLHQSQARVVDLNPYLLDANWGISAEQQQDFFAQIIDQDQASGVRLGFPAERSARILYYNLTWAQELGFTAAPATPGEFQQQVCAAAKANASDSGWQNDGTGGWIIDRSAPTLVSWILAFGADLPAADETNSQYASPEAARAFTYLRELFDGGCAWFSREPLPYEYFATRHALVYSGDLSDIQTQKFYQTRLASQDRWTVIPFPGESPVLAASGLSYAVLQGSPATQLAAWIFIRWMADPENQAEMVRASGTLPLSKSALAELADYTRENPQWNDLIAHMDALHPAPGAASWRLARGILEDAAWQMLQPTPLPAESVLDEVDKLIPEILERQPSP